MNKDLKYGREMGAEEEVVGGPVPFCSVTLLYNMWALLDREPRTK